MTTRPSAFGLFLSPLHRAGQDLYHLIQDDLQLAEFADSLGYDEFWVGEHHSGGWGTIGSPELFLAAAAERTRRIRLATGVIGFPYHHPFMIAERAVLLDHLTRGRFILGGGAGSVTADMAMLGLDPRDARRRLQESAEVVAALLRGEAVTRHTDWFQLDNGRLQFDGFRAGGPELVIASAVTPSGMQLAGRIGAQPLSHAAPPWGVIRPGQPIATANLDAQWGAFAESARAAGHLPDRSRWRVVIPVHVSRNRATAQDELYDGWCRMRNEYWIDTLAMPMSTHPDATARAFEATVATGGIILGSPDDCIEQLDRLTELSGGFGTLLLSCQDWAAPAVQRESLSLFARHVMPELGNRLERTRDAAARTRRVAADLLAANGHAHRDAMAAAPAVPVGAP